MGKKCTKRFSSHDWRGAGIFTFCRGCKVFLLDFNRKQLKPQSGSKGEDND